MVELTGDTADFLNEIPWFDGIIYIILLMGLYVFYKWVNKKFGGWCMMNTFGAWFIGICMILALILVLRVIGSGWLSQVLLWRWSKTFRDTMVHFMTLCDGVCVGGYMVRKLELNHMRDTKFNRRTIISESLLWFVTSLRLLRHT